MQTSFPGLMKKYPLKSVAFIENRAKEREIVRMKWENKIGGRKIESERIFYGRIGITQARQVSGRR